MFKTSPSRIVAALRAKVAQNAMGALPYFAENLPDGRKAKKTPMEDVSRIVPSVALEI